MLMQTRSLPAGRDAVAPDGSGVRILAGSERGSMAHFELDAGQTALAVRHRTVEELWFFVGGRGQMWRRGPDGEELTVDVSAGVSLSIPVGTTFQFRADGDEPLRAVGVTMPPWPGPGEASLADGPWAPTVEPGPA
jgi:mannose-6-phosphate isomerase-like protein (cupin superfamily)